MGRPERPLDPETGPLQRFAVELRELRQAAGGLSYQRLAERAHYSTAALSRAAGGDQLPSLAVTLAYVKACGGDLDAWEARWHTVAGELKHDRQAATAAETPVETRTHDPPYLGLAVYQPADADRFFGREQLIAELVVRLAETPFLAVFGSSGSGKSSLLRAGLLPAVRAGGLAGSQDWPTMLLTPGEHPLEELAIHMASLLRIAPSSLHESLTSNAGDVCQAARQAIRQALIGKPPEARVLVVVDQFEELFTLCHDREERTRFIDVLLSAMDGASGCARVVLGIRADFYGRCAEHPALVAALRDRQVLVGPMCQDELRRVITLPAARAGLRVEPVLVATILGDVRSEPGALPLVSHALLETWRRRRGSKLTLAGYQAAGGVRGAIAQTADQVYSELDDRQQRVARDIFLRLTALGEGTEDTRRRVHLDELDAVDDRAEIAVVLERLAMARLIIIGEDSVEVAHEALIRAWPRLHQWLNNDREGLRTHRQLTQAAQTWESLERDTGALYRGARLAIAREWAARDTHDTELNPLERTFLDASIALEAKERTQRRTHRIRQLATGLTTLLLVAITVGAFALHQRQIALSHQLTIQATALADSNPAASMLLRVEAFRAAPTVEARSNLLSVSAHEGYHAALSGHADVVEGVAFSPDGHTLASTSTDHTVRLWDVAGRSQLATLTGHTNTVYGVAFSPDGRALATASADHTVRLWDVAGRSQLATLTGHTGAVYGVAFSPDGRTLATAGAGGAIRLWDTASRAQIATLTDHSDAAIGVAFSPDGHTLATADLDHMVMLWDVGRHAQITALTGHTGIVYGVAFSPDGRTLATASADRTVRLWDMASHAQLATLTGHTDAAIGVAFSPDGHTLATASADRTIILWDPALLPFISHNGEVTGVAFSPDGRILATVGADRAVRLWDVTRHARLATLTGHNGEVTGVAFSPDGRILATASADRAVRLWDVAGRARLALLTGHNGEVTGVAFSPDGRILATAGADRAVRLWDVTHRTRLATLMGHAGEVTGVAFSPDGRTLATAGADRAVWLWDVTRHARLATLMGHAGEVTGVAFSPDGRTLATTSIDGTVILWDVASRARLATLSGHSGEVTGVAFSPDGHTLATASADRRVIVWEANAERMTAHICAILARSLTPEEWAKFVPGQPYHDTCR